MLTGIANVFATNVVPSKRYDNCVLESDEAYLSKLYDYMKLDYLVVTNLYRDQMTRNGHPELIYDIIKEAITDDIHLILNTDDPGSSLYGYKKNNVTYNTNCAA